MTDLLARLDELHAKATPATWSCYEPSELPGDIRIATDDDLTGRDPQTFRTYLGRVTCSHDQEMSGPAWGAHKKPRMEDVRLMVALRNAYPALREYVEKLESELETRRKLMVNVTMNLAQMYATDAARRAVRG